MFPKTYLGPCQVSMMELPRKATQQMFERGLSRLRLSNHYCVKTVRIWSFFGLYFPAFGLNTERYGVSLLIHSKCGKIRTRKTPNTDAFHAVHSVHIHQMKNITRNPHTLNFCLVVTEAARDFLQKNVLKIFDKSTRKHLRRLLFQ